MHRGIKMNDMAEGLELRDHGVNLTTIKNADWMTKAMGCVELARKYLELPAVNADILRAVVVEWIGEPKSPNAWGALFRHLEDSGKLKYTGHHTRSTRKAARGRQIPVWRWA